MQNSRISFDNLASGAKNRGIVFPPIIQSVSMVCFEDYACYSFHLSVNRAMMNIVDS